MSEQKDKSFVKQSIDKELSSMRADPRLAERIIASEKGENKVNKRISIALVTAIVAVIALAAVAIAEIAGVNIFELFGSSNARYAALAPYTGLDEVSETTVYSVELGQTRAAITSAYYDGQSLIVGYAIQNPSRVDEFTPGDELLKKLTPCDEASTSVWEAENEDEEALLYEFSKAMLEGRAMGIARYSVYPSDHTVTDDGIEILPSSGDVKAGEDGTEYTIMEYDTPLDERLQDLESLNIEIKLYQSAFYQYFDGKALYEYRETSAIEPMRACVLNSNGQTIAFSGSGSYNDIAYSAKARASAANATLEISFDKELPLIGNYDSWYILALFDENGVRLNENEFSNGGVKEITMTYEGTGSLPKELSLVIYVESEGEFDAQAAIEKAEKAVLKAEE